MDGFGERERARQRERTSTSRKWWGVVVVFGAVIMVSVLYKRYSDVPGRGMGRARLFSGDSGNPQAPSAHNVVETANVAYDTSISLEEAYKEWERFAEDDEDCRVVSEESVWDAEVSIDEKPTIYLKCSTSPPTIKSVWAGLNRAAHSMVKKHKPFIIIRLRRNNRSFKADKVSGFLPESAWFWLKRMYEEANRKEAAPPQAKVDNSRQ